MAKVPLVEAEKIAAYEFVESIGDGDNTGSICLNVSRSTVRAEKVKSELGYGGNGIKIAILDTGVNSSHPDLDDLDDNPATADPKVLAERCYVDWDHDGLPDEGPSDDVGHGTLAAGIAAGTGKASNYQYVGTAPGAYIINVKVARLRWKGSVPWGDFHEDDVLSGIDYAISQGVKIISMSIGTNDLTADGASQLTKAVDDAVEKGVTAVVAAGNRVSGHDRIWAPADAFNAITVGAIDDRNNADIANDIVASFSRWGPTLDGRPKPDVLAPGVNIIAPMSRDSAFWQTYPDSRVGDYYYQESGTSMAAPHVAGTVALMLHANPNLTPAQVKAILRQKARLNENIAGLGENLRGHGIVDAYGAVQLAQNVANIDQTQMFDDWNVQTPPNYFDILHTSGNSLSFKVINVQPNYGMDVGLAWYHTWNIFGSQDYPLLLEIVANHVWIDDTYYDFGTNINKYLFSGPRIYDKGGGYALLRAQYKVGSVRVKYLWTMHVDQIKLEIDFQGATSWKTLIYMNVEVWDSTNYPYLPSTSETVYYERKIYDDTLLDIKDPDHSEYVQLDPDSTDSPRMWILRVGYYGNNPKTALNNEYVYNEDIIVYYQATSYVPADINHDGAVGGFDLAIFSSAYGSSVGQPNYDERCDFNEDGVIDAWDLAELGYYWGYIGYNSQASIIQNRK